MNITIVDYNSGNISSVINSFREVGKNRHNINVSSDSKIIRDSDKIVLPGQGSFKTCVDALNRIEGLVESLNHFVFNKKKPLFGICVGLQMVANVGYEEIETKWELDTGSITEIHYDMQVPVLEWCKALDNEYATGILHSAYDAGVSSGEFVKALLKINNTAIELGRACEELNQLELLEKLKEIPKLLLKSIVTPESLYV